MKFKTIIMLILMISTLTIVSAVDLNNLNVPDNFESVGDMTYDNNVSEQELYLITNSSEELKSYFNNDTQLKEIVNPTQKENIYSFTDGTNNMSGCSELIKVDETYYLVELWVSGEADDNKIQEMSDTLTKFNELNNFTAIDPSTI